MTHFQPVCILSWPIQQSAMLRNRRGRSRVRWRMMAIKRVSIMVCLVRHSKAHYPRLSPQAVDLPVSFLAFSHEWGICRLKIQLYPVQYIPPMHDLEMSNGCARNSFYPGCKGFTRLRRIHVKKVLTRKKSCSVSTIATQFNFPNKPDKLLTEWCWFTLALVKG